MIIYTVNPYPIFYAEEKKEDDEERKPRKSSYVNTFFSTDPEDFLKKYAIDKDGFYFL